MPYPSSVSSQAGFIVETTAGTRQAPTTFVEIVSESLKRNPQFIRPRPVANRLMPKRKVLAGQKPAGNVSFPVYPETIGPLLRATLGAVSTTGSNPYTHTITPSVSTVRPSMTWQFGRPDVATSPTVHPFDYVGCYVDQLQLTCNAGEEVMGSVDLLAMREVDDQSLATATFPTVTPLTFIHATLTASGGTECFDQITVTLKNSNFARQQACPTNPGEQKVTPLGVDAYGGTVTRDWRNQDLYDDMVAGTEGTLTLAFNAGASAQLTITGNAFFADAGTVIPGPNQVLKEVVPFEFLSSSADASALTVTLINSVATI